MGDPQQLEQNASQRHRPYLDKKPQPAHVRQGDGADGGIGPGNEHKDHHMVQLFQNAVAAVRQIEGMIGGAGGVQRRHGQHEHAETGQLKDTRPPPGGMDQQRRRGQHSQHQADKMGDGAARILQPKDRPCGVRPGCLRGSRGFAENAFTGVQNMFCHGCSSFKERFIGFIKTHYVFIISVLCMLVKSF